MGNCLSRGEYITQFNVHADRDDDQDVRYYVQSLTIDIINVKVRVCVCMVCVCVCLICIAPRDATMT